jgi:FkbM family methyltransferase
LKKERYFFDHVPKSGGLALRAWFEEILTPEDFSPSVDGLDAEAACIRFSRNRFIGGHVGFRPGAPFDPSRFYFTVMREPVDRIVSLYFYFRHALSPNGNRTIEDAHRYDLGGFVSAVADRRESDVINFQAVHFATIVSRDFGPRATLLGDLARCGLNKFDLVVPFGALEAAPKILGQMLGLENVPALRLVNVTPRRDHVQDISAAARRRIADLNAVDAELYEEASRQFAARMAGGSVESFATNFTPAAANEFGDGGVVIDSIWLGRRGEAVTEIQAGDELTIVLKVRAHETVAGVTAGLQITDEAGLVAFGTNTHHLRVELPVEAGKKYQIEFRLPLDLGPGLFDLTVALHLGASHAERCFHWCDKARRFRVIGTVDYPFGGYAKLHPVVAFSPLRDSAAPGVNRSPLTTLDVISAYRLILDREPSTEEIARCVQAGAGGLSRSALVASFLASDEYANLQARRNPLIPVRCPLESGEMLVNVAASDRDVGSALRATGTYEPYVMRHFQRLVRPGSVVVDIGANIGYFTCAAAMLAGPDGEVHAVEPNPANTSLLLRSVRANRFENVRVYSCAASDAAGALELHGAGGSNGYVQVLKDAAAGGLVVPSARLDQLVGPLLRKLDLIKIDIEGFELPALRGFEDAIRRFRPILFAEFHPYEIERRLGAEAVNDYLAWLCGCYSHRYVIDRTGALLPVPGVAEILSRWREASAQDECVHLDLLCSPSPVDAGA